MPRQIVVDEDWYVESYTDVKGCDPPRKVDSAQEHFETYAFRKAVSPGQVAFMILAKSRPSQKLCACVWLA